MHLLMPIQKRLADALLILDSDSLMLADVLALVDADSDADAC